jgi:sec-independent protein translocase protein TatC
MATSDSLDVEFEPRLRDSMSFVLMVPLAFGIAFQLPVVMLALNRFGIVAMETYTQNWRVALLGVALVSMVLTPTPDATNMLAMFMPLTLLYFVGIFLCRFIPRGYGLGGQQPPLS